MRVLKKSFACYAAIAVLKLFQALPRALGYALAHAAARVCYRLDRRHRNVGRANLRIAFPEQSEAWRLQVLWRSYLNLSDLLVEVSKFPKLTARDISGRVRYTEGSLERYRRAREKNAGLLFLTAHISAWELLPFAHALYGYPLTFVVRPIDDGDLNTLMRHYRTLSGNRIIPKKNALRALLKALQEKKDVGILIDQNVLPDEGVFVPFFGRLACTTNGLAMIALRTGAPVLPGFLLPERRRGHYRIHFAEEIPLYRDGSLEENIRVSTERFNRALEEVIRACPDRWLWLHRRWNTRPPGDQEALYP
ncbi:MAG: lysophospholipid acyltransferase family protein [Acidobacteria bacterium]|nr:lysophospholipid acyltransferase family protein [Acidobacteriota bacterium]